MKNLLFLSFLQYDSLDGNDIYSGLLRQFRDRGYRVYVVSLEEKKRNIPTYLDKKEDHSILHVKIGNYFNVNTIRKGLTTVLLERQAIAALKKHLAAVKIDLVLYATPPISFMRVVRYVKKRHGARSYLMLKDIFPQNAVDLGMLGKTGVKSILYRHFRNQERQLYAVSDRIGCMSQANRSYLLKHNPEIEPERVEICPNSIEVRDLRCDASKRAALREKYGIPADKTVFVYGGNLGKPQGIPFVMECLERAAKIPEAYFLIAGGGTEWGKLDAFFRDKGIRNGKLLKQLPREDFDEMIGACDVGLIFLDHRFTIPNFPSRLLSYLQAGLPVLCCTDPNTDIGQVCEDGGFGWYCESNDPEEFCRRVEGCLQADRGAMGQRGFAYLQEHYSAKCCCDIIIKE